MHTPLDPHLHTEECNKIIAELMRCHKETSKLSQLFGVCNQLDWDMRACTKGERLVRTAENHRLAAERMKRIAEKVRSGKTILDD